MKRDAAPRPEAAGGDGGDAGSLPALDPVIHSQPRLRVVVVLASAGDDSQIAFPRLQEIVGMTAGNLSTHLRKLEDVGYVAVTKAHRRRVPVTYLSLTRAGRRALEDYTSALNALLAAAPTATSHEEPT